MALCRGSWGRLATHSLCPDELVWCPHQKAYIFTFLLSSRLFIEPRELLARVCHLCIEQQQLDKPVLDKVRGWAGQGASESIHILGRDLTGSASLGGNGCSALWKRSLLSYPRPKTCKDRHLGTCAMSQSLVRSS